MKTRIFCDNAFFESTPERKASDDNIKAVIKFFVSSPDSFAFTFSKKQYQDFVNMPQYSELFRLIKKWTDSRISIDFDCAIDPGNNIDKADEVTLYFGSDLLCQEVRQYGEMCVELDKGNDFEDLLETGGFIAKKGDQFNWKVKFESMPSKICNSMIYVDNYTSKEEGMMNLECILDSLLPEALSVEFHLTVVTSPNKKYDDDTLKNKIHKELESWLANHRPDVDFKKLEILIIKTDDNHDRYILTNNYSIYCPKGFDLMRKGKSTQATFVDIDYPFIRIKPHKYDKYVNYIENIRKCFKVRGLESKNRLLCPTTL